VHAGARPRADGLASPVPGPRRDGAEPTWCLGCRVRGGCVTRPRSTCLALSFEGNRPVTYTPAFRAYDLRSRQMSARLSAETPYIAHLGVRSAGHRDQVLRPPLGPPRTPGAARRPRRRSSRRDTTAAVSRRTRTARHGPVGVLDARQIVRFFVLPFCHSRCAPPSYSPRFPMKPRPIVVIQAANVTSSPLRALPGYGD
jgi:hypothetical protein